MTAYEFTLIVAGSHDLTDEVADRLFESGCDDGTPGTCGGVFSIDFHREGRSLEAAIRAAIADVNSAGFDVERVEIRASSFPISA
ncbi:MAG TPA: hypothetical protein PJ982_02850 [Lacipirellulaceae bacterium]|nr:hypothetical protein [Lacipirellulaceae bacterium]